MGFSPDAPQQERELAYGRSFIAFSGRLDHPGSESDG